MRSLTAQRLSRGGDSVSGLYSERFVDASTEVVVAGPGVLLCFQTTDLLFGIGLGLTVGFNGSTEQLLAEGEQAAEGWSCRHHAHHRHVSAQLPPDHSDWRPRE